ncbi:MAG: VWA domain-containing protein [Gammaproteobacteria bacterium]|nr:VWA domain-containing protein [Gammaproteobacteria bacterium]
MRRFPTHHRFSEWDGSQAPEIDADNALGAMVDDLMEYGDLRWAMRNLFSRGMDIPQGGHMQGLRDMLKQLREQKREHLDRFNLSSVFKEIEKELDEILDLERNTIDRWLDGEGEELVDDVMRDVAEKNRARLDKLPDNAAGKMQELEHYEFLNPEAQKRYIELLNQLRRAMTQTFFNDIENMVNNMSKGDIDRMKDMLRDLNDLLSKKAQGVDPDAMKSFFKDFMDKYGDMFGANPPESLEDLVEQMSQQMAAAQSLMDSLTPDQRAQLQSMFADVFGDPDLQNELQRLAQAMSAYAPRSSRYRFGGREDIDLEAAMRLMREMRQLDELINQVQVAERTNDLERIDRDLLKDLLDDDAAESLDDLKKLLDALEKAGYIRPKGDKWELTPRGSRMIGQKALGEIYARLRRQSLGNHALPEEGRFGERLEQTKGYEFGDPFHLHMPRTIRNAIDRDGPRTPVRLKHEDFEIYRSELITSTATAMLVDLSWSMALRGSFQAAKKVALALHNLITSRFPKDSFHVIGFAAYAKELKAHDLPFLQWDEYVLGTNMQHALLLAERLLDKHAAGTKQIIMISDGEPTAHLENGRARFAYPPTAETYRATLRAVKRCTQKSIAINTFMLDVDYHLKAFMDAIARINGGRVFFTSPDKLGEYILVDYVQRKRKKLAR